MSKNLPKADKMHIDESFTPGLCRIYHARFKDNKPAVGYCCVTSEGSDGCLLWHVYVQPSSRKRGIALQLLDELKQGFDSIVTDAVTNEGKDLCLKSGFMFEESAMGRRFLVWRKPKIIS